MECNSLFAIGVGSQVNIVSLFSGVFDFFNDRVFPANGLVLRGEVAALRSTPIALGGKSKICPTEALTSKSGPRYLRIVLAFAGDSTITRDFDM